jgi:hypothetical protein
MLESRPVRPLARFDDLVISQVGNETLVYDQRTHHIHYLDEVTAATWRHSDGRHTVSDLSRVVSLEMAQRLSIATIELALVKLSDVGLLLTPVEATEPRASRRSLLRKAAIGGAVAVPTIVSVSAPQAATAVSTCIGEFCPTDGECCVSGECDGDGNCCSGGFPVCPADGVCCIAGECDGDGNCCSGGFPVCPTDGVCCVAGECDGDGNCCSGGFSVCPTDGVCCFGECDGSGNCCMIGNVCDNGECCDFGTCSGGVCVV